MKDSSILPRSAAREGGENSASIKPALTLPLNQNPLTFFSLPVEIRNYIYQLALVNFDHSFEKRFNEYYAFSIDCSKIEYRKERRERYGIGEEYRRADLLLVNKQFYHEASWILYTQFDFSIGSHLRVNNIKDVLKVIPLHRCSQIRKISMAIVIHADGNTGPPGEISGAVVNLAQQVEAFTLLRQRLSGLTWVLLFFAVGKARYTGPIKNEDGLFQSICQATRPFKGMTKINFEWDESATKFPEFEYQLIVKAFERAEEVIRRGGDW